MSADRPGKSPNTRLWMAYKFHQNSAAAKRNVNKHFFLRNASPTPEDGNIVEDTAVTEALVFDGMLKAMTCLAFP